MKHKCSICHYQGRKDLVKIDIDLSELSKVGWDRIKQAAALENMTIEKFIRHAIHDFSYKDQDVS